jgi:hypothetical protein
MPARLATLLLLLAGTQFISLGLMENCSSNFGARAQRGENEIGLHLAQGLETNRIMINGRIVCRREFLHKCGTPLRTNWKKPKAIYLVE